MSIEFRQRTPSEYLKIISRRKWLIILPIIAVTSAVALVVYRLPDVYESTTLIVVTPSTLPTSVVGTSGEDNISRQLTTIAQVVTSRSSLEPLVKNYDLYATERRRGEPMESVIGLMRRDINVEINNSRNDITNGFNITFKNRDPKTTQAVAAELASKYIDEHLSGSVNKTTAARAFFANQVQQAKADLDAADQKRLDYMNQNLGSLPSEGPSLISQLAGLRDRQKGLMTEIGRLQDRRSTSANQMALLKKASEQIKDDVIENTTDPKTTQAYSQLLMRKASLEGELTRLRQELKDKHPDVIAKQKEIDQVKGDMEDMVGEWKEKIAEKTKKLAGRPDFGVIQLENDIKLIDGEVKRLQGLLDDNDKQIAQLTERINKVPGAEVFLGALEREYQTKKASYDQLLDQQAKIDLSSDAVSQKQGEGIKIIDPANLPSVPVAPRRFLLSAIGLGLGLAIGLLLTAIVEVPRLLTIQSSEDARHYTGLPVLIAVPELLTPQEARSIPRRRRLLLAAGVAATIVSIPLLALALKFTHVFELLSQSSGRA